MTGVKTYASDKVAITFGAHSFKGLADGTFVSIEMMSDGVTSKAGADGEVARSMSADKRCKVAITLLSTSETNTVLSRFYDADQVSGGALPLPLTIKDLRGDTMFAAGSAWIVKKANTEFSQEVGTREWTFETAAAEYIAGGN